VDESGAVVVDFSEISQRLKPISVNIDDLLLDPNNPRLAEIRSAIEPEDQIDNGEIQEDVYNKLMGESGVDNLRASIATVGYLPISVLVVRRHLKRDSKKYIVIEGNRRITAIKSILREAPPGLSGDQLISRRDQLRNVLVYLLDTDLERVNKDRFLLQGIVHLSPIKTWPAFSRAMTCYLLEQQGLRATEISRALGGGISAVEVGRLLRAYCAYKQMTEDEEYGEYAASKRELLSYFAEVVSRTSLKNWLGWNDDLRSFEDETNRHVFYDLLYNEKIRKLTDIRMIDKIRDYNLLDRLIEDDHDIERAYSEAIQLEQATQTPPTIPWRSRIQEVIKLLEIGISLPFSKDDILLLEQLQKLVKQRLIEIKRIVRSS